MRNFCRLAIAAVSLVVFSLGTAYAQPRKDVKLGVLAAEIRKLQKGLKQRDALVQQLLRRVDELERLQRKTPISRPLVDASPLSPSPRGRMDASRKLPGARDTRVQYAEYQKPSEAAAAQPAPANAAPGQFTVSKEAAQRAIERALIQTGALLLPPGKLEFVPGLTYQFNDTNRPHNLALTSTGSVLVTQSVLRDTIIEPQVLFRLGLPWRSEAQLRLPVEYQSLSNETAVEGSGLSEKTQANWGLADPALTVTKQIARAGEWVPNLFLSAEYSANVGELRNGIQLGNGFNEFQIGLSAAKRQDPLVFTGGFVYQTALESRSISLGDEYIPSVGMLLAVSPETSLQFSQQMIFANASQLNGRTIPGSELTEGILTAGVLSTLGSRAAVNFSVGVGETPDAPNLTFQLQFPIRLN